LIYRKGPDGLQTSEERGQELSDMDGDLVANTIPPNVKQGRFSPSGDRIVFTLMDTINQSSDIAVYDIASQTLSRRTFSGQIDRPLWTPDGNKLVYRQSGADGFGLWVMNSDGSGQPEQLMSAPVSLSPTSFSPDGQQLVFTQGVGDEGLIKLLSMQEIENQIQDLFTYAEVQDTAEISPDGRWIVYMSNELNGSRRNFVRPYPNVDGGKWMIADIPSGEAHWGPDGSLYFIGDDGTIYHVEVDTRDGFSTGRPEVLFNSQWTGSMEPNFNISPNGNRIMYIKARVGAIVQTDTLVLVENWFERLKQLAPPSQD